MILKRKPGKTYTFVPVSNIYEWTGAESNSWNQPNNWNPAGTPKEQDQGIVAHGTIDFDGGDFAGNITLEEGTTALVSAASNLKGNVFQRCSNKKQIGRGNFNYRRHLIDVGCDCGSGR